MSRVHSKCLFNFPLTGVIDDDVLQFESKNTATQSISENEASNTATQSISENEANNTATQSISDNEEDFLEMKRSAIVRRILESGEHPAFQQAGRETVTTKLCIRTSHDGSYNVPVLVQTPCTLQGASQNVAYVYAHGGAAIASSAEDHKPPLDHLAVTCQVVVFNVDYRLAPETKCPHNVQDFYEVVKYVCANAASLGVHPDKVVMAGDSAGGYICLGAMVMLAEKGETGLVRLAIPAIPMLDDYCFSDPAAMTKEEQADALSRRRIWKLVAADFEAQKTDPLLFPGKASHELLGKFPPTIIVQCEFDRFITSSGRFAARLRRAGRLLEYIVIPGSKHASYFMAPDLKCSGIWQAAMKTVCREYLHS